MKVEALKRKDRLRTRVPFPVRQFVRGLLVNRFMGRMLAVLFRDLVPHRGYRVETGHPLVTSSAKAALYFGLYERAEIDQICAYLTPGSDVVELGGSIGAATLQILSRVESSARVVVVEADPGLCAVCRSNIARNFPNVSVAVVNAAVDYSGSETVPFDAAGESTSGKVVESGSTRTRLVSAITLRQIIEEHGIDSYVLVADIEGAEIGIFLEDRVSLSMANRIIIEIEGGRWKGRGYQVQDVIELAKGCGFELVHQHANRCVFERRPVVAGAST